MAAQAICAPACISNHPASSIVETAEIIGSKTVSTVFQVSCQACVNAPHKLDAVVTRFDHQDDAVSTIPDHKSLKTDRWGQKAMHHFHKRRPSF